MEKLRVENLNFKVGKVEILKDVSLSVKENSFVGVIGHNGSGKSTMLKSIYGINKPTGGSISKAAIAAYSCSRSAVCSPLVKLPTLTV